ncbi:ASPIC/UnbV domain protein [Acidisarcina polymorpha]|uniref:ASPIC/UnbV domain protein n=1 Tax=Acidisarcina polymorpha TaxID=2211140 RepID=A0A2Z5FWP2_9BACT|nr:FG-GAP-like repeat-containing protein [Acidisarcina polymorpha]AXC11288.1 ASPIC/UnbV domain protein [Acidisarcina polymorpha]
MLAFNHLADDTKSVGMARPHNSKSQLLSRRAILKSMGLTPLLLRPSPLFGSSLLFDSHINSNFARGQDFAFADARLIPHYPAKSPLAAVLRLVSPGLDEYPTEKYVSEIMPAFQQWGQALRQSLSDLSALARCLDPQIEASTLIPRRETTLRSDGAITVLRREFGDEVLAGDERFLAAIQAWVRPISRVETAAFEATAIEEMSSEPLTVSLVIRYDIVASDNKGQREERIGSWRTEWYRNPEGTWKARRWVAGEETHSVARGPVFLDVTAQAMGSTASYLSQLLRGSDYWRTVLDGASGIDVYGNNGVAAGDYDNDGFDDLYICQPAGLPNRLYRNRGDGTFEDVTEKAGVGVLDNCSCALFADFENKGLQDLLVVGGSGPLLFLNQGNGTFSMKPDAFQFKNPPQGTFTHAAVADYDGDGRLDVYFCLYSYYLGLDQYHYPVPYFDARNGPPNFLFHNQGNSTFVDRTEAAGLNAENDRYSFACSWGSSGAKGLPDLFVANDFGRANLYRNNGNGSFTAVSREAHVQDVGAGMSATWCDFDNDGNQDIYAANMWSSAGQRVSAQSPFHEKATPELQALYRRHARGNALYRNQGNGEFRNVSEQSGVEMGRWSWSSDFWDFDHDGWSDLYIANGYISAREDSDLASFFWRQVVAKSPEDSTSSPAYERGWQALNELIRSDTSWNGYERNVLYANNRDGTFSEVSGAVGLNFPEDARSFALADLDHDGRLEVILKNRNAPQLRILHNVMTDLGGSVAFRLRGTKSNRDAIGTAVTVEAGSLRQTKYLQSGSGFLAQHSKELFFGVGKFDQPVQATIRWPSGLTQKFEQLPINHRIEIEEGAVRFVAKPFSAAPPAFAQAGSAPDTQSLPTQIETWLIEPLLAPGFSLPDLAGNTRELRSFRGGLVLLHFWSTTAPLCRDQLRLLHQNLPAFTASQLSIAAINVDDAANNQVAHSYATQQSFPFPILFATEEVAGIYNIIYRYLFDRRRDLAIPTSLLLNEEGMIVKVYQGPLNPGRVLADVREVPKTAAERVQKALPFAGTLYQGSFQRNDFTYGVAMFQHGYLEQAAESFQQVIAAKPDNAEGYYNLGTLNLRRNDLPQARHYLEETVKLRPNYPEAWNNLGMIAAQEGQPDEAIQNLQHSIDLRPGYSIALLNLGNVYRRQGSFAKAQDCLSRALEIQPDDPEVNYSLGMFYAQQNQPRQASNYLEKAISLRPDYAEALNNLGVLFVREQDYTKAEEEFKTCIRTVPAFDQSYLNLARLYVLQKDTEKAKAVLNELLTLQPHNAAAAQAMAILK